MYLYICFWAAQQQLKTECMTSTHVSGDPNRIRGRSPVYFKRVARFPIGAPQARQKQQLASRITSTFSFLASPLTAVPRACGPNHDDNDSECIGEHVACAVAHAGPARVPQL